MEISKILAYIAWTVCIAITVVISGYYRQIKEMGFNPTALLVFLWTYDVVVPIVMFLYPALKHCGV